MSKHIYFEKKLLQTPISTAQLLLHLNNIEGLIYLQNNGNPIIGIFPNQYYIQQNQHLTYYSRQADLTYTPTPCNNSINIETSSAPQNNVGFNGGWMGFIGYDYTAQQTLQHTQPALYLGCYKSYIQQKNGDWFFYSQDEHASYLFEKLQQCLTIKPQINFKMIEPCSPVWSKTQYQNAFNRIQDYIRAGDCYQINLTQQFTGKAQGKLLYTAEALWKLTNAPYAGYIKINNFELLSCSPELFIEFQDHHIIKTRPIKGTMPRYKDPKKDQKSKQQLIDSEKDQAENLMIVDLLRNDLSVYAQTGTVKTNRLFEIESFNQVHHMVSEIQAQLKPDIPPLDMLINALPGGSITGAPKLRAMQIIAELEQQPRGAYCGSLGYFNFDGTGSWNILIRSIQKHRNEISIWAGGGITIASDCNDEYQECFDKISAILSLMNTY